MKTNTGHSEHAVARDCATITCVWQRLKVRQEREIFVVKKNRRAFQVGADWLVV